MKKINIFACVALVSSCSQVFATEFQFDRPGTGFSTSITPVGHLAWEQSLPNATYVEEGNEKTTTLNAEMLLRTGLTDSLELQLGWAGPAWSKVKESGRSSEQHGLGDVSIGVKKAIDLQDDQLSFAVLAQAVIATGNADFSNDNDIYTLGSTVAYQYNDEVDTSITMFYEWQDSHWAVVAVPTLEYKIVGNWIGFSELVYRKAEGQDQKYALGTGVMYALNNRTQLDANVGVDLDGSAKSYKAGLGISFLF